MQSYILIRMLMTLSIAMTAGLAEAQPKPKLKAEASQSSASAPQTAPVVPPGEFKKGNKEPENLPAFSVDPKPTTKPPSADPKLTRVLH